MALSSTKHPTFSTQIQVNWQLYLLREFAEHCQRSGRQLILSGVAPQPLSVLQREGLVELLSVANVLGSYPEALARAREILAENAEA